MSTDWYKLQLTLAGYDEAPFLDALRRCEEAGLTFASFADLGASDEAVHKLYDLNRTCSRDIPNRGEFYTFDEYVSERINVESFDAHGVFVARDGEEWVGMCAVSHRRDDDQCFIEMTGVLPAYRRRGVSLALKVHALRWASSTGAETVKTFHHQENLAAISANEKLGFQRSY